MNFANACFLLGWPNVYQTKRAKLQLPVLHGCFLLFLSALFATAARAESYPMPAATDDLIGHLRATQVYDDSTLLDIARRYDLGRVEIELANAGVSTWLPKLGQTIQLPTQYLLPNAARRGLVLNLPEMRLYHYRHSPEGKPLAVATYPVSIGQQNWQTPLGTSEIVLKRKDPIWIPPESIKLEAEREGRLLPDLVPPGPRNPLGAYALNLAIPRYLLHGTNNPSGIGMRVTHGCVRLYPEDIETLFHQIETGTPIEIINQPVKLGWLGDDLYLEVHPPLKEFHLPDNALFEVAVQLLHQAMTEKPVNIQSSLIRKVVRRRNGVPVRLTILRSNR